MTLKTPMADAVRKAYKQGEDDELMEPIALMGASKKSIGRIKNGDTVIFYDIRGEREIELTKAFTAKSFPHFKRDPEVIAKFVTMIQYHKDLPVDVAFPPLGEIQDTLCEVLTKNKKTVTKITESEKEIHLKFFFHGKRLEKFNGEEDIFIPSPKIANYADFPEMQVSNLTQAVTEALSDPNRHVIVVNIPNVDVLGHIENEESILKAVKAVDDATGTILGKAKEMGVTSLVTADHGTVEKWLYPDGTIDTGHTNSPVDLFLVEPDSSIAESITLEKKGKLIDVAPTMCTILGIEPSKIWEGKSLISENVYAKTPKERVLLLIRDGWGYQPSSKSNLISSSEIETHTTLVDNYPHTLLSASGESVGMPKGSVGNSEVGHIHLGCGRVIKSDRVRIEQSLETGEFYSNPAFVNAIKESKKAGTSLHLLGIISFYSSHGSIKHLKALMKLAKDLGHPEVYIHGMLGRRGEKPESGAIYTEEIEQECEKLGLGRLVSLMGRYWSLDREENWDRIEKTYNCLVSGQKNYIVVNE